MKAHLIKVPQGYIVHKNGTPTHVVETCPDELKETHGNVIALCPVKKLNPIEAIAWMVQQGYLI